MDDKKYLDIFLKEAEEHLSALQKGLLVLEKEPANRDLIHGLLRNAHTLKGSARMLGYDRISAVAHRMEDLLKEVEDGERQVDTAVIDVLLRGTDAITHLTTLMAKGEEPGPQTERLLASFEGGEAPQPARNDVPQQETVESDTVRANVRTLDNLVNLIGEMIINKKRFEEKISRLRSLCQSPDDAIPVAAVAEFGRDLEQDVLYLSYLIQEVHGEAMALRMLPLKTVTEGLERMVRDVAKAQDKQVVLEITGESIELDRVLLDCLKPVLMHVVTNSVDHGIEPPAERLANGKTAHGTLQIAARYEGNRVRIDIRDDGRGIDPDLIRRTAVRRGIASRKEAESASDDDILYLILRPGFSTSEIVTDLSGRGVGMDVVQKNVERVKGTLSLFSRKGSHTEVSLLLPLTLSVIDALIVACADEFYAIPLTYVQETLKVRSEDIQTVGAKEVVTVRGSTVPLVSLANLLGFAEKKTLLPQRKLSVVVLKLRDQALACTIDGNLGNAEIVVKALGEQLKNVDFISGATILGDGCPALIINVTDIFAAADGMPTTSFRQVLEEQEEEVFRGSILIVDDSITTRTMERSILVANGYRVDLAVSGEDAMEKVVGTRFDLIVSDIEMPGMDGFELTRKVRGLEGYQDVPVIIVSSRSRDEDKRRALEAGAQAYIVKGSFDQGVLLDTVDALIG